MIKLSAGTAHVLGLKKIVTDAPPTTAYLLIGESCQQNCSFCAQAVESSSSRDKLSRVRWQEYDREQIITSLQEKEGKIDRVCLQAVDNQTAEEEVINLLSDLQNKVELPICVSQKISSLQEVKVLIEQGADKVTIALDAVGDKRFNELKQGSYHHQYRLLTEAAKQFPGRIATHLIVGLGETEREFINLLLTLRDLEVTAGLFAFTPLADTKLEAYPRPSLANYRRLQIAHHLIYQHHYQWKQFRFQEGQLVEITGDWKALINESTFQTPGCDGCNRPYYNERPGGKIYNYPRPLTEEELARAAGESELISS